MTYFWKRDLTKQADEQMDKNTRDYNYEMKKTIEMVKYFSGNTHARPAEGPLN